MKKKLTATAMALTMALSLAACGGGGSNNATSTASAGTAEGGTVEQEGTGAFADAKKGDIITFGAYEQDGDTTNGAEAIEWIVLENGSDGVLCVSRYVLDCKRYHEKKEDVTWETCNLREWMNGAFLNEAFSGEEQSQIRESSLTNPENSLQKTSGGNDTKDRVFCLSVEEVRQYFEFETWNDTTMYGTSSALAATPTAYATANGVKADNSTWWLRGPGQGLNAACVVDTAGTAGYAMSNYVDSGFYGVRPALRLNP